MSENHRFGAFEPLSSGYHTLRKKYAPMVRAKTFLQGVKDVTSSPYLLFAGDGGLDVTRRILKYAGYKSPSL